jgi:hypothetical protein
MGAGHQIGGGVVELLVLVVAQAPRQDGADLVTPAGRAIGDAEPPQRIVARGWAPC